MLKMKNMKTLLRLIFLQYQFFVRTYKPSILLTFFLTTNTMQLFLFVFLNVIFINCLSSSFCKLSFVVRLLSFFVYFVGKALIKLH